MKDVLQATAAAAVMLAVGASGTAAWIIYSRPSLALLLAAARLCG
jgi:hypothetical protein